MFNVTRTEGKTIEIEVDGKILHEDYQNLIPKLESIIREHAKLRCLITIKDIESIEPRALLDDLKFDLKHALDIERCAVVCEENWMTWATKLWGVFMPATRVQTFKPDQLDQARQWLDKP